MGIILAQWLRENGYDVVAVIERMPGISDDIVLQRALIENRIIITLDNDFGEIIFKKNLAHAGIVFLRLEDEQPANQKKNLYV